jgi:hypothetical protein
MKAKVFLIVRRDGDYRVTKRPPFLDRGEICLRLGVTIPDACFQAPAIDVQVEVPADRVRAPEVVVDIEDAEAG